MNYRRLFIIDDDSKLTTYENVNGKIVIVISEQSDDDDFKIVVLEKGDIPILIKELKKLHDSLSEI